MRRPFKIKRVPVPFDPSSGSGLAHAFVSLPAGPFDEDEGTVATVPEIKRLAAQGLPMTEIARRVGLSTGAIQTALGKRNVETTRGVKANG